MNRLAATILLVLSISAVAHATEEYLTLLGFELEKTDLFKIQNRLGKTPIKHTGDAAESYDGICYTSGENNATVYFESGEMGGPEHTLLGFTVKRTGETSQVCGDLDGHHADLKLGAIELGKNIDVVRRELPQPVKNMPGGVEYQQISRLPFTEEDRKSTQIKDVGNAYWDVTVTIRVFEENGAVVGYEVSKVTTW